MAEDEEFLLEASLAEMNETDAEIIHSMFAMDAGFIGPHDASDIEFSLSGGGDAGIASEEHILRLFNDLGDAPTDIRQTAATDTHTSPRRSIEDSNEDETVDGADDGTEDDSGSRETGEDANNSSSSGEDGDADDPLASVEKRSYYVTATLGSEYDEETHVCLHDAINVYGEPLRSINDEILWTLSSARPGTGIHELLDPDPGKFWQSDGMAPHHILVAFYKRQSVAEIALLLNYASDESYTPNDIIVRAGNTMIDCEDVVRVKLEEPTGWVRIPLVNNLKQGPQRYLRAHYLTISIVSNHQAGRDCHLRGIQILGPAHTESKFQLHTFTAVPAYGTTIR